MILECDKAGQRLVEVDYDTYAEGEAVLGWLNGTIALSGQQINWDEFAKKFLALLSQKIDSMGASVGHVKILLEAAEKYTVGNLTGKFNTLSFREKAGVSNEAQIIINARVGVSPETLDQMVKETLNSVNRDSVILQIKAWQCLSPGYPNPTHRYNRVA
jgi:hypothetical protein